MNVNKINKTFIKELGLKCLKNYILTFTKKIILRFHPTVHILQQNPLVSGNLKENKVQTSYKFRVNQQMIKKNRNKS